MLIFLFGVKLKAIHFVNTQTVSTQSSDLDKRILLTKPFQASQSWHQLSVYENKIRAQNCLLNEWTLVATTVQVH